MMNSAVALLQADPANIYLLRVSNRSTTKRSEIYLKLTIRTPKQRQRRSDVFINNFEHISQLVLLFPLLT